MLAMVVVQWCDLMALARKRDRHAIVKRVWVFVDVRVSEGGGECLEVVVLQCGVVWCSVFAVWCRVLQCVAAWCSVVQCGSVVQCDAV